MPELPEVETVKRVIEPQIKGRLIEKVTVKRPEVVAYPAADEFCGQLAGQTVSRMERRGKFLMICLHEEDRIILHLRMTGCLLLVPKELPEEKHTHIIFHLDNGKELRFSDMRRFGRFWLIRKGEDDSYSGVKKLGIEPNDKALTADYLYMHFGKRKKTVKECLLEQSAVAGIGNIYSDEILFAAGIHPTRLANSLKTAEWEQLAAAIPERIAYFTLKNQISPEDYLETKGQDYRNTQFLQVYGHAGKPCPKCGGTFCRMVVGGRGSVYCPVCQKEAGM
ncbi:MAG: bifunctional DNA-formamidopyrimidine glycosylase/DNA-(apurinic or apyrimidinic site) lyase [Bacteroidales bacterium]|nr:bifunctional DNA-formamidopyrimidine glycosylase/DNA-(apurinic or apyrimidinic site) lyase [Bacteroidales bacterium]MCM1417008.1 bifunctional DNA-formamidopyrimidine glycosylase/DNA-(apurinic or apyrimidinic site) lyase [bacterium]MCM1423392.1 bifunctional DNA-formamidopyrimidine glycosylase/DNA-(apurinic or apyrimidinic site) lyase [bacterium]